MTEETNVYTVRTAELHRAFDQSFAKAHAETAEELDSVLAFSVAGSRFAVRLNEIGGIAKSPIIVPVPSKTRALRGLAGIRGELLPVFSLSELLGYGGTDAIRWLLLCKEPARAGLGISDFFGCFRAPKTAFSPSSRPADEAPSQEVLVIDSTLYTIIGMSSLTQLIGKSTEGA